MWPQQPGRQTQDWEVNSTQHATHTQRLGAEPSRRQLLEPKSLRWRASHHDRADLLSVQSNEETDNSVHKHKEIEQVVERARNLLSMPMSRRERLQLANKERARTERRARARKKREELLEDLEGADLGPRLKDSMKLSKPRRQNPRRKPERQDTLILNNFAASSGASNPQTQGLAESTTRELAENAQSKENSSRNAAHGGSGQANQAVAREVALSTTGNDALQTSTDSNWEAQIAALQTAKPQQVREAGVAAVGGLAQEAGGHADLPAELGGDTAVIEAGGGADAAKFSELRPLASKADSSTADSAAMALAAQSMNGFQLLPGLSGAAQGQRNSADLAVGEPHLNYKPRLPHVQAVTAGGGQAAAALGAAAIVPPFKFRKSIDVTKTQANSSHMGVSDEEWKQRQSMIVQACKDSWAAYSKYAMGFDELAPLSLKGKNSFGNLGAMVIDSLDTLWMFGLKEEFQAAKTWVETSFNLEQDSVVSFFETTIRLLGGLLSAFELSTEAVFLQKAQLLTDKLMISCREDYVLCDNSVHLNQPLRQAIAFSTNMLAEFATLQMEFKVLSHHTQDPKYALKADNMIKPLHAAFPDVGILPLPFDQKTGVPASPEARKSGMLTMGGMADSAYEYFLKVWLLTGKKEEMYRQRWELAMDEALQRLVGVNDDGLTYVTNIWNPGSIHLKPTHMEHLTCFLPGNIALGVGERAVSADKGQEYMELAKKLTYTCWQMYERTNTGLGVENGDFRNSNLPLMTTQPVNRLRPEAVESFYYLWRATGNPEYRDWGWAVFEAFQHHSRTPEGAYASVQDVNKVPVVKIDTMESFWTAETLKYLWLLFGSGDEISLKEWVFNTEAHPLRIFEVDTSYSWNSSTLIEHES